MRGAQSAPPGLNRVKATTEVEFSFDDVMYRQVDGVAMGSPLGPILANIFCGYCESKLKPEEIPPLYRRFVDDTFSIFNGGEEGAVSFFERLNSLHPVLRFTMECEQERKLPFMDVLLTRRDGKLVRSVYCKPTFTRLYVRWDSFSPMDQKIAAVKSLVSRAMRICSASELDGELAIIRSIFGNNGFPTAVIDRTIQRIRTRFIENKTSDLVERKASEVASSVVVLRLPWIGQQSIKFRNDIKRVIVRGFPAATPQVVFTSTRAFSGRAKDVLPASSKSCLIYKFTCDCASTYVGRTCQSLTERIKQHLPNRLFEQGSKTKKTATDSAITRHVREHPACLEKSPRERFKIVAMARDQWHLGVLEALYIKAYHPDLCSQKEHVRVLNLF